MQLFNEKEISQIINKKNIAFSKKNNTINNIITNSRFCSDGTLFVGLIGKHLNGSDFLKQALENGATIAIVKEPENSYKSIELKETALEYKAGLFLVDNPIKTLQNLAKYYVMKFPDIIKIAITGSSGKTTLRQMLCGIIKENASIVTNIDNFNGDIGFPLSCFQIRSHHEYAIMEMGTDHTGEIAELVDIFSPDYAIIINIGHAHLEKFGSLKAIALEKKAIFMNFNGNQIAFIPQKDQFASLLALNINGRVIFFSTSTLKRFENAQNLGIDGWFIYYHDKKIHLKFPGKHNPSNALLVIEIACQLGIKPQVIKEGLEKIYPQNNRNEILKGKITVLNDCYNANPESMLAVIHFVNLLRYKRKILFLGQMEELGEDSREIHANLAEAIITCDCHAVFLLGIYMKHLEVRLKQLQYSGHIFSFILYENAELALKQFLQKEDFLLIKGSRAMKLERLIKSLTVMGLIQTNQFLQKFNKIESSVV